MFSARILRIIALALLAAFVLAGCGGKTITIGMLAKMDSFIGQTGANIAQQYVEQINKNGGINGYKINLVVYDTRSDAGEAVNGLKRLVSKDNAVVVFGLEASSRAIPASAVALESKIPVITTTATNEAVTIDAKTKQLNPYMFRVCFIDPYQGYVLGDFAASELKLKKAAILGNVDDPYAAGVSQYFERRFSELGGQIVAREGYQTNEVEFRAQLTNIKNKGAEVVLIPTASYQDAALAGKQAADLGVKVQFLGGDAWVSPDLLKMAPTQLEGSFVSSLVAMDLPEFKEWNAAYKKSFNVEPSVYSYMAMDALKLIEWALRTQNAFDRESMRKALENAKNVDLHTVKGFNMDPATHNPLKRPATMLTIKDGQWKVHTTYTPK